MQLNGEQQIAAPRDKVWAALNDPEILRRCIPGCQSLEKESDDRFAAVIQIKIGPIGARFNGAVSLKDLDPPKSYTIVGEGKGGVAGNAKGNARVTLEDNAGGTLLRYSVDAEVAGRLAQLGGAIVEATAKQLAAKFFKCFEEAVTGQGANAQAANVQPAASAQAAPVSAAAPVSQPVSSSANAGVPATASAFPLPLVLLMSVALIAGWLLGQSGGDTLWLLGVVVLAVVALGCGWQAGKGANR